MTFEEFVKEYLGKTVGYPTNNQYYGECLSLVKWYIKECFDINPPASGCNGAKCYYSLFPSPLGTVFKKVAKETGLIPKKGWIAVWDGNFGNGSGHIGIIANKESTTEYFHSIDQNWEGKQAKIVRHTYQNVHGFLVPISENQKEKDMTYQRFYEKFLESFREYKDTIDWGDDKFKFESDGLNDEAMIKRMVDSIYKAKQSRLSRISELEDKLNNNNQSNNNGIDMSVWEENGLTIEVKYDDRTETINYKRK